ncbi:MAG: DUF4340 domain-containing protein [Gammaproteobacteria bacterium]|nr:DUF4340 domain-containing protein [Gammaproteobacteria bacterium]
MSRRTLIILAGLSLVLAAILVLSRFDFGRGQDTGGLHAPGLAERIGDLESLRVVHAGNEVLATLLRGENGWVVAEKDRHPANFERFRSLLDALAQARRVERKTARAEFYSRLGVDDPSGPEATGYLLELDYGGRHPAEGFIVGRRAGAGMAYIRTAGEAQSWMVSADFDLSDLARDWLDREVIDLASGDIRRVMLDRGGEDRLEIRKDDAGDLNFTPLDIPEGRELSYGSVANSIAGALANVEANDVRSAAEVSGLPRAAEASYETFDGLKLSLDVRKDAAALTEEGADDDPRYWVVFSAAAMPARNQGEREDEADGEASGSSGETDPQEAAPGPEERAAQLNAKLGGWAYQLPVYKSDQWFKTMNDLLKDE